MIDDITAQSSQPQSKRANVGVLAWAMAMGCMAAATCAGAAPLGYVGILGGGPVYKHIPKNIAELKKSGFNELIVWSVEVNSVGDLNLNGEFPLTSAGTYIGNQTHPQFPADLAAIKNGTVTRVTLSVGSSNYGDWEDIMALVNAQGTGPDSILYKDFAAIKAALPVDAIDFDDENGYDAPSTIKFAVMLSSLGYKVTMNPYTNNEYWTSTVAAINKQSAGTVDAIHLQTFAGGYGNSPCKGWNFGSVPVYPGISDQSSAPPYLTPAQTQGDVARLNMKCGVNGGWIWIFDQIAGTRDVKKYAHAITAGAGGTPR
jgi:hypothetical protein